MTYSPRSMTWCSIVAVCLTVSGGSPAIAQSAGLAAVYVGADSIVVEPTVPYELSITISGPDGLRIEEEFYAGGAVLHGAGALPDGYYKYEISILSLGTKLDTSQSAALQPGGDENGRPVGAAALRVPAGLVSGPTQQSGGFRVLNGAIVDPSVLE